MVVAFGATHRGAQPDLGGGAHAVHNVLGEILLRVGAALVVRHHVAMEAGGNLLVDGRIRQQVAGELLDGELIEGFVVVERLDHPVAPQMHLPEAIEVIAAGIGVARLIQPRQREPFAIMRRGEEALDQLPVGVRAFIRDEVVHGRHRRRQAGQVEREPANERVAVGFGIGLEPFLFQRTEDEAIHVIARPLLVLHFRRSGTFRRDIRPMLRPLRALHDPAAQQVHLRGGQLLARLGGRHVVVVFRRECDDGEQAALLRLACDEGKPAGIKFLERVFLQVQAQAGLAFVLVRAVAGVAVLGKDGADVAPEIDRQRSGRCSRTGGNGEPQAPRHQQSRVKMSRFDHGTVCLTPSKPVVSGKVHQMPCPPVQQKPLRELAPGKASREKRGLSRCHN